MERQAEELASCDGHCITAVPEERMWGSRLNSELLLLTCFEL